MKGKEIFRKLMIVILCIAVNFSGKFIAEELRLPIWFDMVGTCLATYYTGVAGGVAAGVFGNILFSSLDSTSLIYGLISFIAAFAIALCVKRGYMEELAKAAMCSMGIGFLCVVLSAPINILFFEGYSGNMWGDALFEMLTWMGFPLAVSAVMDELVVEILDKQICILLSYFVIWMMKRYRKDGVKKSAATIIAIGLVLLCVPMPVQAKGLRQAVNGNYIPTVYNNQSGMMSSEANAIAETSDGMIWIGSYAGLTQYDGREFRFMQASGIANVTSMLTDMEGRLWIGTNDSGIARYENGVFRFFTTGDGLPSNSIRAIAQKADGTVYIATTDKLCVFDKSDRITCLDNGITYVVSLAVAGKYVVGIDNNSKVFALDGGDNLMKVSDELKGSGAGCIASTSRGLLLGTANQGLCIVELVRGTLEKVGEVNAPFANVSVVRESKNGKIWICSEDHLGFLETDGIFHEMKYEDFLSSYENVYEDYQGNIWVASSRYGVLKLSTSPFVDVFGVADADESVVNAVVFYKGDLYCGTDSGLVVLDGKNWVQKQNSLVDRLGNDRIRGLKVDSENALWISTYSADGLVCYHADGAMDFYNTTTMQVTGDKFRCTEELPGHVIAAGTSNGIQFLQDKKLLGKITAADGLANAQILCMTLGSDGKLYVGSDGGGIYVVEDQKLMKHYGVEDGLSSGVILRLVPQEDGMLIVTSNSLCHMDGTGAIEVLKSFPYFNNFDILAQNETAYVTSSAGVYATNLKELCEDEVSQYRLYNYNEGLIGALTANSWNTTDEKGVLYFCTNSGVIAFTDEEQGIDIPYRFGLVTVTCDGEEVSPDADGVYRIPGKTKKIDIAGSVRNFAMRDIKTKFFIDGLEETPELYDYKEMETIQLNRLSSGTYYVHFQIYDRSGQSILNEKIYTLVKESQMWETGWYRGYLLFVIVEFVAFVTWAVILLINLSKRKGELEIVREELEGRIHTQMEEIKEQQKKMENLYLQTVSALGDAVDAKDRYTSGHSKRVASYAKAIAGRMGKTQEEQLEAYYAGLLHDVGKIRIPDEIINKQEKLTEEEYNYIKLHPVAGYHILREVSGNRHFSEGARFHHECYDGSGYPNGLIGENIPEIARIIAVADSYDAMASNRSYRKALPQEVVRAELVKGRGTQFDPAIVDVMVQLIDEDKDYTMKQEEDTVKNILVVDDEPMNIRMVEFVMKSESNFSILKANSGERALDVMREKEVHLVLLDIEMPGMNGFETLEKIREISQIPVVFMTADKDLSTIQRADALGVDDYLTKPFLPLALKEIVHSILGQ